MKRRILVAVGTRPEFVKMAPVVEAIRDEIDVHVVSTGQHWDPRMAGQFFRDLDLVPDEIWRLPKSTPKRMGTLVRKAFSALDAQRPDAVMVLGDTFTVPVFALAARSQGVPLIHVEAGLRSYNPQSSEEVNRRIAGATAGLHLAPTERARLTLEHEGVDSSLIVVTGNPAIDAMQRHGPRRVPLEQHWGVVFTAHRPTNVDDPERLREIVSIARYLGRLSGSVDFPVHPRTRKRLVRTGLWSELAADPGVNVTEPVSYGEMLLSVARAALVVTDSGGLQEEAAWYGVPAIVMRRSTPRWEGIELGIAALSGVSLPYVRVAAARFLEPDAARRVFETPCPYGDGHASERIAAVLSRDETWRLLELREPDFRSEVPEV